MSYRKYLMTSDEPPSELYKTVKIDTDPDTISKQAANVAICNACGKIDCDKMDKCDKLQLPSANNSEFPNSSDTISRQAVKEKSMTKEEIIHRLQYARYRIDDVTYAPDVLKAIDIAIEAVGNTDSDTISRQVAIDALDEIEAEVAEGFGFEYEKWRKYFCDLPPAQLANDTKVALSLLVDRFENVLSEIREINGDDTVCKWCEYNGAYIGQSGNWDNVCPGFDKENCFKLKDSYRKELESIDG